MEEELGLAWREALRRGRIHLERLSAHAPDYLAALKGLAKGAKISEEEAGLLDARYEIFYSAYAKEAGQECTSLAVLPERSAYRELILAQNWDWIPGIQGAWLLFESPDFQVLAFTEAGIPGGKIGINSAGLGLCVNGVFSPWDRWDGEGLPFHARAWMVLQSRVLAEAQEIIRSGFSPCPEIFSLDKKMKRFPWSARPHQTCVLTPNHGVLAHANPLRSS
jgi:isopenicillin-N N-acyltransferase-like protein